MNRGCFLLALMVGCAPDAGEDSDAFVGGPGQAGDAVAATLDARATDMDGGPTPDPEQAACKPLAAHLESLPDAPYAADCASLDGEERFLCGEYWFWIALSFDIEARSETWDRLGALIEASDPATEGKDLGRMHALRGQLALALTLENGDGSHLAEILPDFERAAELNPDNAIIPTWKDSMDIALTWRLGDAGDLQEIAERAWENVERCPTGNILSISGTTIGLPLSTGIPQKTIELLDGWSCEAGDFCEQNTWRAPYAQPGLAYHFAEAYARVGRQDDARAYLERALQAPGGDTWPYRQMAEETLSELDAVVAEFEALGDDGDAFDRMYANQSFGCVFCHSSDPPERLRRSTRIGAEPEPEPDAGVEPTPDAGVTPDEGVAPSPDAGMGEPSGACDNDDDTAALDEHAGLRDTMGQCALQCFGQNAACGAGCVRDAVGVSQGCADCFGEILACTLMHCAIQCIDSASAACAECQEANCLPAFESCAGVSPP